MTTEDIQNTENPENTPPAVPVASAVAPQTMRERLGRFFKRSKSKPEGNMDEAILAMFIEERRSELRFRRVKRIFFIGFLVYIVAAAIWGSIQKNGFTPSFGSKQVAIISVNGKIGADPTSARQIIPVLRRAFSNDKVEAVVLRIDSPGGSPGDSEQIYAEINALKEKYPKPVETVIENVGASAAYLIAIHTDRITAGRYSLVGSIGAIMTSMDASKVLKRFEVAQNVYKSGPLKDMNSPFREPSEADRIKSQSLVDRLAGDFAQEVRDLRGDKLAAADITSGEVWAGEDAHTMGLVDEVGTLATVLARYQDAQPREYSPIQAPGLGDLIPKLAQSFAQAFVGALSQTTVE